MRYSIDLCNALVESLTRSRQCSGRHRHLRLTGFVVRARRVSELRQQLLRSSSAAAAAAAARLAATDQPMTAAEQVPGTWCCQCLRMAIGGNVNTTIWKFARESLRQTANGSTQYTQCMASESRGPQMRHYIATLCAFALKIVRDDEFQMNVSAADKY